jgi:hypothetical protein
MRTGLATSTVTPGSTAPLVSLTVPVNELCAYAMAGMPSATAAQATHVLRRLFMCLSID